MRPTSDNRTEGAIRTAVGAYRQADLEAMDADQLRQVRDWASDRFVEHQNGHTERDTLADPCRECTYYELLAGAADDLLLGIGRQEDL